MAKNLHTSIKPILLAVIFSIITISFPYNSFAQKYSSAVKNYFKEIAVGSEFGKGRKIVKWTKNMKVFLMGEKVPALDTELNKIIGELNQLVRPIRIQRVYSKAQANFFIFFGSSRDYINKIEPNARKYANRNLALFYVYFTPQNSIDKGSMYVNTSLLKASDTRRHLLREELTQALGLMNDSHKYSESIFYQKFSRATKYTSMDKKLIKLLYSNKIRPGMSKNQVNQVLANL